MSSIIRVVLVIGCFLVQAAHAGHYHDVSYFKPWQDGKGLGELVYDTSSMNKEAEQHFIIGLKSLHAYEFPSAVYSFKKAQELDPKFAMAYWGEAMSNFMLVWYAKDLSKARDALKRLHEQVEVNALPEKEQLFIAAIEKLADKKGQHLQPYDKRSSVWAFRRAMKNLHDKYPDDIEATVFYGYSILGTRRGTSDFDTQKLSSQYFNEVLVKNPLHPGALHYTLHAFENPVQAFRARNSAITVRENFTSAIHLLHMPAHYFFTQGDWDSVISINENSWAKAKLRAKDLNLSNDTYEFHGYGWVLYAALQKQDYKKAYEVIQNLYEVAEPDSAMKRNYIVRARAMYLIAAPRDVRWEKVQATRFKIDDLPLDAFAADMFARAYVAYQQTDKAMITKLLADYTAKVNKTNLATVAPPSLDAVKVMAMQIKAMKLWAHGNKKAAIALMQEVVPQEEASVHEHGIPLVIKPSAELLGDMLLAEARPGEAQFYYHKTLTDLPGRFESMHGIIVAERKKQAFYS